MIGVFTNTMAQALPMNTMVLVDAISCCTGSANYWGRALRQLCELLTAVWQRPIAIVPCYRLGPSVSDPQQPPTHRCQGHCKYMSVDRGDETARLAFRRRLIRSLMSVRGLEATIIAAGALAQWTCLGPDGILPHAALSYPIAKFRTMVEAVWRINASRLLISAGYDDDCRVLERVRGDWLSLLTTCYLRNALPPGV